MKEPLIKCDHLKKAYHTQPAVEDVSLHVYEGEILAVVGPSGCGKTTTLRLIAGFERPERGEIWMQGRLLSSPDIFVPPEKRRIGVVFQDYALFPHLTVYENVAFGLRKQPHPQVNRQVNQMLELVGLNHLGKRMPHELSGGERQRVALARALAPRPQVLLLDEPFSSLDLDLRLKLREEVRTLLKGMGLTALFVTHDQEEALYMGDRLAIMNEGVVQQLDQPEVIFSQPINPFVAEFMGSANFLPGRVVEQGIETEIGLIPQQVSLPAGSEVELAVRADDVGFDLKGPANGVILSRVFKGVMNVYKVRLHSGLVLEAFQPHYRLFAEGQPVRVFADAGHELACFHNGAAIKGDERHLDGVTKD
ncbi:ABC-type spermidine/putrescine transport system, ATPase component [Bellilinea caldifistulae]|uniref:ABC-type quaternary amine transporter n=1 Tax=Bellilinea caldifistulae TaxID=360411 RepID=A0A0P6XHS3_9CHLR|nr:ABC transporter ATP-binding protein [Bellilinea caldifistulae]KPL74469.1 ABC transporter [Bellilinea caldifistulae]GAP11657.1 ABC-type spermidine/putrescine transport system, ATPase component [Bellilinea caldifistulae]